MNLIYSSAADVVVWLGEQDLYSNLVIRCCALLERSRGRFAPCIPHKPQEYVPNYIDQPCADDIYSLSKAFVQEIWTDTHILSLFGNMDILRSAFEKRGRKFSDYLEEKHSDHNAYVWLFTGLNCLLPRPYFHRTWIY